MKQYGNKNYTFLSVWTELLCRNNYNKQVIFSDAFIQIRILI